MKIDMLMPQMGESIAEATIVKWLKNPGDRVEKDEIILEISTDKVDSEIPSPAAGVLTEVLFAANDVVPVKAKIATIETEASGASKESVASTTSAPVAVAVTTKDQSETSDADESGRYYSPLVKGLAEKHGISESELATITGSGQGGRVSKSDLLEYIEKGKPTPSAAPSPVNQSSPSASAGTPGPTKAAPQSKPPTRPTDWDGDGVKVVPMDNMRQAIAEHMVRSKQTSPHVYSVQEVDCSKISKYRAMHKKKFEEREGFGLSFTPFFLEAAVKALLEFPHINASVDGKKIILKKNINLGCAVALPNNGLIVPVIRHAEEKNFVGIARSLSDLALRARNKKLVPADVSGGTFTVTNPGIFGTMIGTPIINQPQVAILCLGAIKKRPVVVDDMIAIREICYLTLSYDHRIVDGSLGGQFLAYIREYLENWDMDRALY